MSIYSLPVSSFCKPTEGFVGSCYSHENPFLLLVSQRTSTYLPPNLISEQIFPSIAIILWYFDIFQATPVTIFLNMFSYRMNIDNT